MLPLKECTYIQTLHVSNFSVRACKPRTVQAEFIAVLEFFRGGALCSCCEEGYIVESEVAMKCTSYHLPQPHHPGTSVLSFYLPATPRVSAKYLIHSVRGIIQTVRGRITEKLQYPIHSNTGTLYDEVCYSVCANIAVATLCCKRDYGINCSTRTLSVERESRFSTTPTAESNPRPVTVPFKQIFQRRENFYHFALPPSIVQ